MESDAGFAQEIKKPNRDTDPHGSRPVVSLPGLLCLKTPQWYPGLRIAQLENTGLVQASRVQAGNW